MWKGDLAHERYKEIRRWKGVIRCECFFFQAEDGIRDYKVTGVQTCALPIISRILSSDHIVEMIPPLSTLGREFLTSTAFERKGEIGRASCRERV